MSSLLAIVAWGVAFGAMSAIPMGPVAVLILRRTVQNGPRSGLVVLAGLLIAEAIYLVFFLVGLGELILGTSFLRHAIFLLGAGLLLYIGTSALRSHQTPDVPPIRPSGSLFREGFLLTITNPAIMLIFASLLGSARAAFGEELVRTHKVTLLIAMEIGCALWFLILVAMLVRLPPRLVEVVRRFANQASAWVLCGFGVWLLVTTLLELSGLRLASEQIQGDPRQTINEGAGPSVALGIRFPPSPDELPVLLAVRALVSGTEVALATGTESAWLVDSP